MKKENLWAKSYLHSHNGCWHISVHNQAGTCSSSFQMCWHICGCKSRELCQRSIHQCLEWEKGCWSSPWESKPGMQELDGICTGMCKQNGLSNTSCLINKSYNFTLGSGFCMCSYEWSSKIWTNFMEDFETWHGKGSEDSPHWGQWFALRSWSRRNSTNSIIFLRKEMSRE